MFPRYYSLESREKLQNYLNVYFPLVENVANSFGIDLYNTEIMGDHLGAQALSAEEFNIIDGLLGRYCSKLHGGVIHNRRNNIYKLNKPLLYKSIEIPLIEIFEPKPEADLSKLKPGIEHISFKVKDYDGFIDWFKVAGHPIDKEVEVNGSKFFKTKLMNLVEIEFRNGPIF